MSRQKLGLGQSKVTPVEMEIAKSAKQESRGFSHERFKRMFNSESLIEIHWSYMLSSVFGYEHI